MMAGKDVARNTNTREPGPAIVLATMGVAAGAVLGVWGSVVLGEKITDTGQEVPGNPVVAVIDLVQSPGAMAPSQRT